MTQNKDKVLFSIVMPTYNRAHLIGKAIESILGQEFTNFELIIVNDGGTDNTEEVVRSFNDPRIQYYWKENEQKAVAKNFGFDKARGRYVSSFDDDDLMKPIHLTEAKSLIEENNEPAAVYVHYEIINENGEIIGEPAPIQGELNDVLIYKNPLSNNGVFMRKDVLSEIRYTTNPKMKLSADWLLWLSLSARHPIFYSNTSTHQVLEHDNRGSSSATPDDFLGVREAFFEEIERDKVLKDKFKNKLHKTKGHFNTYIALFLVLQGYKKQALIFFMQGVILSPMELFTCRTLAIFKYLILR